MTIERAMEILDPKHREHYDDLTEVNDACRMGMEALSCIQRCKMAAELPGTLRKMADTMRMGVTSPGDRAAVLRAAAVLERIMAFST